MPLKVNKNFVFIILIIILISGCSLNLKKNKPSNDTVKSAIETQGKNNEKNETGETDSESESILSPQCDFLNYDKWNVFNDDNGILSFKYPDCWKRKLPDMDIEHSFAMEISSSTALKIPYLNVMYGDYSYLDDIFSKTETKELTINGSKAAQEIYVFDIDKCDNKYKKYLQNTSSTSTMQMYDFICGKDGDYYNRKIIKLWINKKIITTVNSPAQGVALKIVYDNRDENDYEKIINKIAATMAFDCLDDIDYDLIQKDKHYPNGYYIGRVKEISPDKNFSLRILPGDYENNKKQWFSLTDLRNKNNTKFYFEGESTPPGYEEKYLRTTFNWVDNENILIYQHGLDPKNLGFAAWKLNIKNYSKKRIFFTAKNYSENIYKFDYNSKEFKYIQDNGKLTIINLNSGESKVLMDLPNFSLGKVGLSWSNNGKKLIYFYNVGKNEDYNENIDLVDLTTKKITNISAGKIGKLYGTRIYDIWSPSDTKIKLDGGLKIYIISDKKTIDLNDVLQKISFFGISAWKDDNSIIVNTRNGKVLLNINDLSYQTIAQ